MQTRINILYIVHFCFNSKLNFPRISNYCYTGKPEKTTVAFNIAGSKARLLNGEMNNGLLMASYPIVADN